MTALCYLAYAGARNLHGGLLDATDTAAATGHARAILALERRLGLAWEQGFQAPFLAHPDLLRAVGGFYGGAHFGVTAGVLVWLLARRRQAYRTWRATLAVTTALALAVFAACPVLPPRLLPPGEGTVDTLATHGGLWSYNHGVLEHISDPYAAMPSLHLAWAMWCAMALWAALPARSTPLRLALAGYPAATFLAVMITGNHYLLDGLAGIATTVVAALLVKAVAARPPRWLSRRAAGCRPAAAATPDLTSDNCHCLK